MLCVLHVISYHDVLLWKLRATDVIVFAGAVLTNPAIACVRKPGGVIA